MTATTEKPAILIAHDEPPFRRYLRLMLSVQGYRVMEAADALQALAKVERKGLGLVLIKFDLAGGLEVIRRVRQSGSKLPLIVLLNRGDKRGKINAFAEGADDCLIRPFPADELIARVKAALPRHGEPDGASFTSGILTVDLAHRAAMIGAKPIHLSPREYAILELLIARPGKICSYSSLIRQVWGANGQLQNLRNYIQQLRQKIEPDPSHPTYILTESSIGYRIVSM